MGTNRRYGERRDELKINRTAEQRQVPPVSLGDLELNLALDPRKRGAATYKVRAWVTFADGRTARIYGSAEEWTSKAVHVQWPVGDGEWRDAWVWASAVEKL